MPLLVELTLELPLLAVPELALPVVEVPAPELPEPVVDCELPVAVVEPDAPPTPVAPVELASSQPLAITTKPNSPTQRMNTAIRAAYQPALARRGPPVLRSSIGCSNRC